MSRPVWRSVQSSSITIGRVASVNSLRLEVELEVEGPGVVVGGASGVQTVGTINSYITIPAGTQRIIAVVTGVRILERTLSAPASSSRLTVTIKLLEATMIGRVELGAFRQGVSLYPSINAPVHAATPLDVSRVFSSTGGPSFAIGEAVVSPGQNIVIDANALITKHAAVLGSTGTGKSFTVTAIIDGILGLGTTNATIVVLDANGEYAAAFNNEKRREKARPVVLGFGSGEVPFVLPHWFMNNQEHLALVRASEGAQAPLLQRAVTDARLGDDDVHAYLSSLILLLRLLDRVERLTTVDSRKPQEALYYALLSLKNDVSSRVARYAGEAKREEFWKGAAATLEVLDDIGLNPNVWDQPVTLEQQERIRAVFETVRQSVSGELNAAGLGNAAVASDFDAPRYYELQNLLEEYLPARIAIEAIAEPRIRAFASTMQMRLSRVLADSRLDFFTRVPRFDDALALYLRLLFGVPAVGAAETFLPPWHEHSAPQEPSGHQVIIVDLSAVASELIELVAGLLGRLILDLAQRFDRRAGFPVLLVLEEAHRYVPNRSEDSSGVTATPVFERIAKEGRKFGVGLIVASQRPSELSRTLLAQCGTLLVHRIVNPEDQALIRSATPYAGRDVLDQLAGLAQQHAIIIGEAVPAPSYVRINDVVSGPRSADPPVISAWTNTTIADVGNAIDKAARHWEGGSPSTAVGNGNATS